MTAEKEKQVKEEQVKEEPVKDVKEENEGTKFVDLIYTIKPAIICENIFGIFRFRVVDNDLVKPSWLMKFSGVTISLAFIALFCMYINFPTAINGTGNVVDAVYEIPSIVVLIQYVTSVITTMFFISNSTIRIFSSIANLDTMLRINMNEDFYNESRRQTIISLIILYLSHVIIGTIDILTDKKFDAFKILVLVLYTEQDLEIFVFCKMVYMLKSRLGVINDYLAKFDLEQKSISSVFTVSKKEMVSEKKFNFIGRVSPDNTKIRDLAIMYDTIGETCAGVNDVFNFQIFANLLSTFIYIVVSIWTTLYYIKTPDDISGQLITVVIWSVLTVLSVAVMSFTCEYLQSTRRNTKILVNEIIMDYDLPRSMRVQAKVFMELIEAWPLRIFVYDMFSVDITLMLKFISVATTFLIVVVQVGHFV